MPKRYYSGGRIRISHEQAAVIEHLTTEALAQTTQGTEPWYRWALRDLRHKARPHVQRNDTATQRLLGPPTDVGHKSQVHVAHNAGLTTGGI